MLGYLAARAIRGVEHVSGGVYRRTIAVDGDPGAIEIALGGPGHLVLTAHLPHWNGLIHVVQQVRRLFNLDVDLAAADAALRRDPLLGRSIAALPGLRVPWGLGSLRGRRARDRRPAGVGRRRGHDHRPPGRAPSVPPVPGLGQFGLTHLFPPAGTLAERRPATGSGSPAHGWPRSTTSRGSRDGTLPPRPEPAARRSRRRRRARCPGLGPWTAHYLALRMGEPDAFPSSDLGLRRSLERLPGTDGCSPRGWRRSPKAGGRGAPRRRSTSGLIASVREVESTSPVRQFRTVRAASRSRDAGADFPLQSHPRSRRLPDHVPACLDNAAHRQQPFTSPSVEPATRGPASVHDGASTVTDDAWRRPRAAARGDPRLDVQAVPIASRWWRASRRSRWCSIDLACRIVPEPEVLTLDTGRLHEETHRYIEQVRERYPIRLRILVPTPSSSETMTAEHGTCSSAARWRCATSAARCAR